MSFGMDGIFPSQSGKDDTEDFLFCSAQKKDYKISKITKKSELLARRIAKIMTLRTQTRTKKVRTRKIFRKSVIFSRLAWFPNKNLFLSHLNFRCPKVLSEQSSCFRSAKFLEAFSVDDGGTAFVVFSFGDPASVEGRQRGQDGATDPDGVLTLWWCDDLDLHGGWGELGDLLLHTIGDTGEHGGTAGQDDVGVQVLSDVQVGVHDGVVGGLVDADGFQTEVGGLEHGLGGSETLVADGDDLTVGQLVILLQGGTGFGCFHLRFVVQGDVGQFLLDITDDFSFC